MDQNCMIKTVVAGNSVQIQIFILGSGDKTPVITLRW